MNINWLGMAWSAIKGAFSFGTTAKLSIVDYLLEAAYEWYSNIERVMENIAKAHSGLVTLCDKLDYYSKYVPVPWMAVYQNFRDALAALRDTLADGRVDRAEIAKVIGHVAAAREAWNA